MNRLPKLWQCDRLKYLTQINKQLLAANIPSWPAHSWMRFVNACKRLECWIFRGTDLPKDNEELFQC
jgi:hypothetical protein